MVSKSRKCLSCKQKYTPYRKGRKMVKGYKTCPNCNSNNTACVSECEKNETLFEFKIKKDDKYG